MNVDSESRCHGQATKRASHFRKSREEKRFFYLFKLTATRSFTRHPKSLHTIVRARTKKFECIGIVNDFHISQSTRKMMTKKHAKIDLDYEKKQQKVECQE